MARLTPQQIADKQIKRATASVADYKQGVQGVSESPTAAAARKKDKYLQGVQDAVNSGAYEDGLNSVTREDWIQATVTKGGDRYAPGISASRDKIVEFQTQFSPHREAIRQEVSAMPDDTFEQRMARMDANARGLHNFTYKRRRSRTRV